MGAPAASPPAVEVLQRGGEALMGANDIPSKAASFLSAYAIGCRGNLSSWATCRQQASRLSQGRTLGQNPGGGAQPASAPPRTSPSQDAPRPLLPPCPSAPLRLCQRAGGEGRGTTLFIMDLLRLGMTLGSARPRPRRAASAPRGPVCREVRELLRREGTGADLSLAD